MDPTIVDKLDARINRMGASLFFHPATTAYGAEQGIDNVFILYAGRAGLMGDIDAEQATSALCFFAPNVVADVWKGMESYGKPSSIGAVFAAGMAAAARSAWNTEASETVARLGLKVVEHVTPMGMALFAGWRRLARNRDATCIVHALRELRGDIHIQSIALQGLRPLEAEMVSRGVPGAELHGWKPPYPDPQPFEARVSAANAVTSARMCAIYGEALTEREFTELQRAVQALA